jgi:hypothetical protein
MGNFVLLQLAAVSAFQAGSREVYLRGVLWDPFTSIEETSVLGGL